MLRRAPKLPSNEHFFSVILDVFKLPALNTISHQTLRGTLPSLSSSTLLTPPSSWKILPGRVLTHTSTTSPVIIPLAVLSGAPQNYSKDKSLTRVSSTDNFLFYIFPLMDVYINTL